MGSATRSLVALALAGLLFGVGCGGGTSGGGNGNNDGQVDLFAQRIAPILDTSCACHTADDPKGGIVLRGATYGSVLGQGLVSAGAPDDSALIYSMNPAGANPYFRDPSEVETLQAWIRDGAPEWGEAAALPDNTPRFVGIDNCVVCHAGFPTAPVYKWLAGAHGNQEDVDLATHAQTSANGVDSQGFPYYGYHGLGEEPEEGEEGCALVCHDQLGDGQLLTEELTGNVPRPVVGCESCHGAGSNHNGSGPIPFPKPDASRCGQCHNQAFDHNRYHPEGDNIVEDYASSPHSRSANERIFAADSSTDARARCSKCHTDEGARRFRNVDGGHEHLAEELGDAVAPVAGVSPVQCRTCHDGHQPKKLLEGALLDGQEVVESAEFRTCTNCHQWQDGYHGEGSSHSWSGREVEVGAFRANRIIYDTHRDDPATTDIEGYIIDPASPRACRNCHNQHAADITINLQWVRSGHGGRIAVAKEEAALQEGAGAAEAVYGAAVTDDLAPAWLHYDFKEQSGGRDGTGRQACQRCHTTTGFIAYVTDPETYDPAASDFSWIGKGVPESFVPDPADAELGDERREMLYCYGCHSDNAGGLRNPGAMQADYADAPYTYPDAGPSNLCMACHTGRESGQSIANSAGDFSNQSFVNSHYLTAGGVVFRATGYEFPGRDYANVAYYKHDKIGLEGALDGVDTGTKGPCVTCHMGAAEGEVPNHTYLPFERDEAGHFTAITNPVCAACHYASEERDTTITPEILNEQEEGYQAALHALEGLLNGAGFYFQPSYPYFFSQPDTTDRNLGVRDWARGAGNDAGKNNMGAAFNFNLLHHDPGAFAHNRYYSKRLIYDSIDWLDDQLLNNSVMDTLAALPAGTGYQEAAVAYLNRIGR